MSTAFAFGYWASVDSLARAAGIWEKGMNGPWLALKLIRKRKQDGTLLVHPDQAGSKNIGSIPVEIYGMILRHLVRITAADYDKPQKRPKGRSTSCYEEEEEEFDEYGRPGGDQDVEKANQILKLLADFSLVKALTPPMDYGGYESFESDLEEPLVEENYLISVQFTRLTLLSTSKPADKPEQGQRRISFSVESKLVSHRNPALNEGSHVALDPAAIQWALTQEPFLVSFSKLFALTVTPSMRRPAAVISTIEPDKSQIGGILNVSKKKRVQKPKLIIYTPHAPRMHHMDYY